jgi:MFS superfamily sulfate permease-like transporter
VLYRFDAPLTFFNADHFKTRVLTLADKAGPGLRWFVVDAIPISRIDLTALYALRDLRQRLEARGTLLILAGRKTELLIWFRKAGLYRPEHEKWFFPTLRQALKAYQRETSAIGPQVDQNL